MHVLAVGNLELDVNAKEGEGENPSGASLGIPVAKDNMSSNFNVNVVSFTTTSPVLDSVKKIINTIFKHSN